MKIGMNRWMRLFVVFSSVALLSVFGVTLAATPSAVGQSPDDSHMYLPLIGVPLPYDDVEPPPPVVGDLASVAAGAFHTCALTESGDVMCWGDNRSGRLGDGTTTARYTPVAVAGLASDVTALAAGGGHTCALTGSGGVLCWGDNRRGQLGDGTTADRHTPVAVAGLASGVASLAAGRFHTCAASESGGVMCWGANFFGQLGDGTTTERHTLVAVAGLASGVTALAAGALHTCALTGSGGVLCWGENRNGQLGDGTTAARHTPVAVAGLTRGVTAFAAGASHTCALTGSGGVLCWGDNGDGQLGDGTTTDRHTPVAVVWQ